MKILLYGGTFDPPHKGHLNNLRAAASRVRPDKVIVMPAGVPPHKQASATPAALRLEMCSCFRTLTESETPVAKEIEVSDWEIVQSEAGRRNYTVLTLEMLAETYPTAELYLAVGSDMLLSFDRWYRWQRILRLAYAVVVSRTDGDALALKKRAEELDGTGKRILFAQAEALPMASSQLRAAIAAGEDVSEALPAGVLAVIRREGLYRAKTEFVKTDGR